MIDKLIISNAKAKLWYNETVAKGKLIRNLFARKVTKYFMLWVRRIFLTLNLFW